MAKKAKGATTAADAVMAARENPYVQRFLDDEDLRDNMKVAFESGRSAYARLTNGKPAQKVLFDDKKFHKDLTKAADALKDAGEALKEGPKKKRSGGIGRLILIAILGTIIALAVSEDLRNKVLDLLFGAEEEFEYTSTTTPAPAPEPAAAGS
ncbi:MAG: hypothetical protein JHC84_21135 [Solirubrobacteraceae bacterium]|nr:hypothetical protein [Solirubrobacteraceae bacterium]